MISLVLLLSPTIYIVWRFRSILNKWWKRLLAFLPDILLLTTGFWINSHRTFSADDYDVTGFFTMAILSYAAIKIIFSLCCLTGSIFRKKRNIENMFIGIGFAICVAILGIVVYGYNWGIYKLQVKHSDITFKDLPEGFDGYRIAFFSDFHLGTYGNHREFPHKVVDAILNEQPDIILFGGDLINQDTGELLPFLSEMRRLKAPHGVFSVMGNHDYQIHRKWNSKLAQRNSIRKFQGLERAAGWNLLLNESSVITRSGDSIAIVGVENDGKPPFPEYGNLPKALGNLPGTHQGKPFFKVLLSHDPSHWQRKILPQTDIQLTLSGHTHACQFQLAGFSPASWMYKEWAGLYQQGNRQLFVSKGIGEALLNFRFGAWPEINIITLHCQKK